MAAREIAGRYRLEERLGTGAMSEVWAAQDTELERRVAIKLLGRDADPARFEREARAAAALSHPNICQLYDYGTADDGRPFMVLECLEPATLEDRLVGTPLPDDETERISRDVAAGLAHAHSRGVLHRDLKPGNILFDSEGRAKIADLGIARMSGAGTLTEAGTVLGTAAYISPEQARGEPASPASDVYSFGVILYRMLTGRLPFEAQDPLALVALHANSEPTPIFELRPDTPPHLESVATAALSKDPADRPADGSALYAELEPSATGATVIAAAPAPAPTEATVVAPRAAAATDRVAVAPPPRRGPGRAAAIIAAALLLAGGGVAAAYMATDNKGESDGSTTSTLPPLTASVPKERTETVDTETEIEDPEPTTTEATTTTPTTTDKKTTTRRTRPSTTNAIVPPPPPPPPPPPTDTLPTEPVTTEPPPTTEPATTEIVPPPPPPPPPPPAPPSPPAAAQ